MAIITGCSGALYVMNVSAAMTDEATSENSTNVYQISDTDKQIWNPNSTEEGTTVGKIIMSTNVTLDGSYQDNGIDYFNGIVRVNTTTEVTSDITVTGEYVTIQKVGYITGFTIAIDIDVADLTPIGTSWKEIVPLGKGATVTLTRYRYDHLMTHTADNDWILMKLLETGTTTGYWCKTLRTNLSYAKTVGSVDNESTSFTVSSIVARIT